jgi:signal transduction histidine kinase
VDETLRSIPTLVEPLMRSAGVRFEYRGCETSLAVLGDRERIVQICVNLLANAARATAQGGLVRLGCEPSGEHVLVFVSDTGCGIPPHRREDIFSPFTQLGRSFSAPRTGTGLGLSISRGLAEAMGGTLTVDSEVGAGSTFTLALKQS